MSLELMESVSVAGVPKDAGTIALKRTSGVPRLYIKSPLLENYFRTISKGMTEKNPDTVFGTTLYRLQMEKTTDAEFVNDAGVLLGNSNQFYGTLPNGNVWFNLAFIRSVGVGEGLHLNIHSMLPTKLIENGVFAKTIRQGITKLIKEFIVDFDVELGFTYRGRTE